VQKEKVGGMVTDTFRPRKKVVSPGRQAAVPVEVVNDDEFDMVPARKKKITKQPFVGQRVHVRHLNPKYVGERASRENETWNTRRGPRGPSNTRPHVVFEHPVGGTT